MPWPGGHEAARDGRAGISGRDLGQRLVIGTVLVAQRQRWLGLVQTAVALIGFRGGEARLCDQRGNEGAEQGFSSATGIVDELEEAEIGRQLLLRDAAMGT